jgi:ribosomal protein L20
MANLTKQNISINRKMLSEMAISNPDEFKTLVENVMGAKA